MKTIGSLLSEYESTSKGQKKSQFIEGFDFLTLIKLWPNIIGEKNARRAIPLKNQNKVLTLATPHSSISQNLSFMETMLIERIIKTIPSLEGKITKINFINDSAIFKRQESLLEEQVKGQQDAKSETDIRNYHHLDPRVIQIKNEAKQFVADLDFDTEDQAMANQIESIFIQFKLRDL